MTYTRSTYYGITEVRCEPGEKFLPVDCTRHSNHYWCATCAGYYGVPHNLIHTGRDKHPNRFYRDCACRVCRDHAASITAR
ncbi:hypothetical protein AB0383_20365 [Amycolatopsis sp. NPDC051373]|uniref:hypothetical protein n=1 Tax=Amycolatopsis sp. NPDC051373 TaxID=3155801 RepID=UPI003450ADC2